MPQKRTLKLILFFVFGTLMLIPGFYCNQWNVLTMDYHSWQLGFDRTVIARLVKSRQDGILSAGGLLGLGDVKKWKFDTETSLHQIEVYENGEKFKTYFVYKSSPAIQGIVFSIFDRYTDFQPNENIFIFRGLIVVLTSIILAFFCFLLAVEFGWLAATFVLLFIVFSEWITLLAGSIYWNLWAFYLPFVIAILYLAKIADQRDKFRAIGLYTAIFITACIKVLVNGFEAITTAFVMITVPFVYFAVRDKWGWKFFFVQMVKLGIVLTVVVIVGLIILSVQIASNEGNVSEAISYVFEVFNRRAIGNPESNLDYAGYSDSLQASYFDVIWRYLNIRALTIKILQYSWQILYWHLLLLFVIFSYLLIVKYRNEVDQKRINIGRALLISTWYSILAPLSWLIIFKPTSIIHDNIFPFVWQMPYTLLGFALLGFVLSTNKLLQSNKENLPVVES